MYDGSLKNIIEQYSIIFLLGGKRIIIAPISVAIDEMVILASRSSSSTQLPYISIE